MRQREKLELKTNLKSPKVVEAQFPVEYYASLARSLQELCFRMLKWESQETGYNLR